MTDPNLLDEELVAEFLSEAVERVESLDQLFLDLEATPDDPAIIDSIFRSVHTIKGNSGFFGFSHLAGLTHAGENLLNALRDGRRHASPEVIDLLLTLGDAIRKMVETVGRERHDGKNDYAELRDRLEAAVSTSPPYEPGFNPFDPSLFPDSGVLEIEVPFVDEDTLPHAAPQPALDDDEASLDALFAAQSAPAELPITRHEGAAKAAPRVPPASPAPVLNAGPPAPPHETAVPTAGEAAQVGRPAAQAPAPIAVDTPPDTKKLALEGRAPEEDDDSDNKGGKPRSNANDTIRVRVGLISDLMNQVGELVLARNQCLQFMANRDTEGLERALSNLNHVTTALQENMMKTRLQSVSNVFSKFPRIVRDLARISGKEVRLVTKGENTEVDKTLIEAITGPLTHILRNAIDHGLEKPSIRESRGKVRQGTLTLEASHQNQHVVISVSDDGAGMDPEKLKAKALQKGIIDPAEAARMTPSAAINLIFAPGFSTAEQVTSISGRGVGMDVVRSEIERVNGVVEIDSKVGLGTRIELHIPLTLAIIPALNVEVSQNTFAIPQVNMVEVVQFPADQAERVFQSLGDARLMFFRDEWIPVMKMHTFLRLMTPEVESEYLTIAVVRSGLQQVGIIVNRVVDSQEIVVKPLLSALQRIGCYAGTAILGNGRVVLILDVAGLMRMARIETRQAAEEVLAVTTTDVQQLLLCDHGGQLVVFPLALVARIEEVEHRSIQTVGGRASVIFGRKMLNLVRADHHLPLPALTDAERSHVLVFQFGGHEVGIMVDRVVESIQLHTAIMEDPAQGKGILGTLIHNNRGVLLLDVFHLIETDIPAWFTLVNASRPSVKQGTVQVLLAEDSDFFRKLVTSYLESAGYTVTSGVDGEAALTLFRRREFDIVVTDIEMPIMDGYELTKQIRQSDNGKNIPILALTSLTSDASRRRAQEAGVSDYLIKLNREEILHAVAHQLGRE